MILTVPPSPLFPPGSVSIPFEITQAYIERRFVERGTPTVHDACTSTHTHTRARTDERRDREKNRIPRQTGTFRAVFASRPQQSPFPLSHPARIVSFEYDQRELT